MRTVSRRLADIHRRQAVQAKIKNRGESCNISWQRTIIQHESIKHRRQLPLPGILAQI